MFGKETYNSKRDSYHGVKIDGHMKKMEKKHREREALRKEQRQAERAIDKKEQEVEREKMHGSARFRSEKSWRYISGI